MVLTVRLNGTPFLKYGLTQNPFPQLDEYEYYGQCIRLQKLGADPIPNVEFIREHLKDFSGEFVELCCKLFKPGEMVEFNVVWRD